MWPKKKQTVAPPTSELDGSVLSILIADTNSSFSKSQLLNALAAYPFSGGLVLDNENLGESLTRLIAADKIEADADGTGAYVLTKQGA